MKNTLLFIMHMPPPVHGASMMGKYIHDSKMINAAYECCYVNLTTARDLADIGKARLSKVVQLLRLLSAIYRTVREKRPQWVYVTSNACGGPFYKEFVIVQFLKLLGCRIVVHYHNKGVAGRQDRFLDHLLYRRFFKGIKVILLAEALYQDVGKYVSRKDVYICANGIPAETVDADMLPKEERAVPKLLFLSNLLIEKGVLVLLDACKILKEKGYIFQCDFVGGESAEMDAHRFREEVAMRGIEDIAIYHGKRFGAEKLSFFRSTGLFVLPTFYHNECFPLVLLEAMQQGVACIASNEGGIPDIIEHGKTGFIVEKKNPALLAQRIGQLLDNPAMCKEMGQAGQEKFQKEFTLERFEKRMTEIFQSLLECRIYD